jgi:sarcosine oxidase
VVYAKTCPYDMPPDRHHIHDALAGYPSVIVGNGAAHAGKFASLLGETLSDLAVRGTSNYETSPSRADRPALTDVDVVPVSV